MRKIKTIYILLITLVMTTLANGQANKPAKDYLGVPGPMVFENRAYNLSWSAHPGAAFYKHEYLVKGDDANRYKRMLMMDVITGETNIKSTVEAKIAEIKKLKEGNPLVNYEVMNNAKTGEYLLDFLLTANAPDGTVNIVERNVYRYKTFTDKGGHKGVMLFAVSTRGYGAEVTGFLTNLKLARKDLVNKVAQFAVPAINIIN